jgi:hypothetical protein
VKAKQLGLPDALTRAALGAEAGHA